MFHHGLLATLFLAWTCLSLAIEGNEELTLKEEKRASAFRDFLEDVGDVYFGGKAPTKRSQKEHLVLSKLLQVVDMDPTLIDQRPLTTNWMEELHIRTQMLAPSAFWQVFVTPPPQEDFDVVVDLDVYAQSISHSMQDLQQFAFTPHRDRGMIAAMSVCGDEWIFTPEFSRDSGYHSGSDTFYNFMRILVTLNNNPLCVSQHNNTLRTQSKT